MNFLTENKGVYQNFITPNLKHYKLNAISIISIKMRQLSTKRRRKISGSKMKLHYQIRK